ncbi:uncharacterized protein LOC127716172 [Mytilus californianus]|uniref:uncharacterized protein LOC127716172 n=1 Tax=Mytilus californianus TaxID=6549 RepID=UPI002247155A|nr:uncharacterized protein LOC127716172 [Mytilus californianus]
MVLMCTDSMAAAPDSAFCGICEVRHITKASTYWCPECDEGLCTECHEHHSISKATRKHGVISIKNYRKLPTSIANIANFCTEHDMKFENYCPHHNKICCPACISTNHKNCVGLHLLRDVLKTAKSSTLFDSIEMSIQDIKTNIDTIIKDRIDDLTRFLHQREKCRNEIKQLRIVINSHLDELEEQILKKLNAVEMEVNLKTDKLVADLSEKTKYADILQANITSVKKYGSDLQAYMGSKLIEADVEKEEKYLQSLTKNRSLQQNLLQCKIDDKILKLSSITTFGSISISLGSVSVSLKSERQKQAQIFTKIPTDIKRTVKDITLSCASKIEMTGDLFKDSDIRDAVVLSNGQIIFADFSQRRLIVLKIDGTLEKTVSVTSGPFAITNISDKAVAISAIRAAEIIEIDTGNIKVNIKTNGECQCIDYHFAREMIVCYVKSKGIQSIQLYDKTISTIVKARGDSKSGSIYIAVQGDNIYESRSEQHTISCYTLIGEKLWVFNNTYLLAYPLAISLDEDSNVFVCSYYTNSVVVLSSDGTKCKKILSFEDEISRPCALFFDIKRTNLLFAKTSGPIYVYNVS